MDKGSKSSKRKEPGSSASQKSGGGNYNARKRVRMHDARSIMAQTSDAALSKGELDLQAFMKAREFEIGALEDAMKRSKASLTTRAFQNVPRELRRRTASHNVKRVPKRLRRRAAREMKEDNTPTVNSRTRKPGTSRGRLRAETAKRLGLLAAKKRAVKDETLKKMGIDVDAIHEGFQLRAAKPKKKHAKLQDPPNTGSPFRRRQIHKTWLPTHIWHAKRAEMTPPKQPLWRFALPLRPTAKAYRISHRASSISGALCWDTSYMSTIGLEGEEESLKQILLALGTDKDVWTTKGDKYRTGKRAWKGWASFADNAGPGERRMIGPMTVLWCNTRPVLENGSEESARQKIFLRVHPSIFMEIWAETLRVSRHLRPTVSVHDLRFDIGSIELTGPASTEALLGVLHPYVQPDQPLDPHSEAFKSLAGLGNAALLPQNALLYFSILDPRLRYPPRKVKLPKPDDENAKMKLLELACEWPLDNTEASAALFGAETRWKASRLPSQKAINQRKGAASPGTFPELRPTDPPIPIILQASRPASSSSAQGNWTLLAPWKCIVPIWHLLMQFPLSSGANPRLGGQYQLNQISFERGEPVFPDDYPGLAAGWDRELVKRREKKAYFDRRPPAKKTNFETLDLGLGRKGEIGHGWACDFSVFKTSPDGEGDVKMGDDTSVDSTTKLPFPHLPTKEFSSILKQPLLVATPSISTVRISLFTRGVFSRNARIYRLPSANAHQSSDGPDLRTQWLAHLPQPIKSKKQNPQVLSKAKQQRLNNILQNSDLPNHEKRRLLARSFLDAPVLYSSEPTEEIHPPVPDEADLIGFVTSGEFNLAEGKATAVGSLFVPRAVEAVRSAGKGKGREGRICVIRDAGETVGRLGIWEPVGL